MKEVSAAEGRKVGRSSEIKLSEGMWLSNDKLFRRTIRRFGRLAKTGLSERTGRALFGGAMDCIVYVR